MADGSASGTTSVTVFSARDAGDADAVGARGTDAAGEGGIGDASTGWEWSYPFTGYARSGGAEC
jgi:hypothetical protein